MGGIQLSRSPASNLWHGGGGIQPPAMPGHGGTTDGLLQNPAKLETLSSSSQTHTNAQAACHPRRTTLLQESTMHPVPGHYSNVLLTDMERSENITGNQTPSLYLQQQTRCVLSAEEDSIMHFCKPLLSLQVWGHP